MRLLAFVILIYHCVLSAAAETPLEFEADHYERDAKANRIRARGNVWMKKNGREIWADSVDIDSENDIAYANGNVHIIDGKIEIWADSADYHLNKEQAVLVDARLTTGTLVMSGKRIEKFNSLRYRIDEGSYTNCNIDLLKGKDLLTCEYEWKLAGRVFDITVEEYAHIYDATAYVKSIPILYSPYFVSPVKTIRQTGILHPSMMFRQGLGEGFTLPFYWAPASWHDLTLTPTLWVGSGHHFLLDYRYIFSEKKHGTFSFAFDKQRFTGTRDAPSASTPPTYGALGIFGEWSVNFNNIFQVTPSSFIRSNIKLVSHPYYTNFFGKEVDAIDGTPSLRSRISYSIPYDKDFLAIDTMLHQNLLVSLDAGIDRGPVARVPAVYYSRTTSPLFGKLFSYEIDTKFENFMRPGAAHDSVPTSFNTSNTEHEDPGYPSTYTQGDFIRTGRRLQIEPRLVANIPMPGGVQLQPVLKAGAFLYHFDLPRSSVAHREYSEIEIPASLYFSKAFSWGIPGFDKMTHLIQPRLVYGKSLFFNQTSNHEFFDSSGFNTARGLAPPLFDAQDRYANFEYIRLELINRIRRTFESGSERFLLFQVSEQYNSIPTPTIPKYSKRVGPIEVLAEVRISNFRTIFQGLFQLQETQFIQNFAVANSLRESDWSLGVGFVSQTSLDSVNFNTRFTTRANDGLSDKVAVITLYKELPWFFDIGASVDYSFKGPGGSLRKYELTTVIRSKPRSCWSLMFSLGRNSNAEHYGNFSFLFDFGSPK